MEPSRASGPLTLPAAFRSSTATNQLICKSPLPKNSHQFVDLPPISLPLRASIFATPPSCGWHAFGLFLGLSLVTLGRNPASTCQPPPSAIKAAAGFRDGRFVPRRFPKWRHSLEASEQREGCHWASTSTKIVFFVARKSVSSAATPYIKNVSSFSFPVARRGRSPRSVRVCDKRSQHAPHKNPQNGIAPSRTRLLWLARRQSTAGNDVRENDDGLTATAASITGAGPVVPGRKRIIIDRILMSIHNWIHAVARAATPCSVRPGRFRRLVDEQTGLTGTSFMRARSCFGADSRFQTACRREFVSPPTSPTAPSITRVPGAPDSPDLPLGMGGHVRHGRY
jgi:hypothetical protein